MTCRDCENELLIGEMSPGAAAHLQTCAACRELDAKLNAVDSTVRAVPTPVAASRSQSAFLQSLTPTVPKKVPARRMPTIAWATAAAVLVAVGLGAFLMQPAREAQARSQVVDSLVEWNLQISETEEPAHRERLHQDRQPGLQQAVQSARLSPRERELAHQLLDHGDWLATHDDPLDAADRFQDLSDAVLVLLEENPTQPRDSERYAGFVVKLNDRGVVANLARAAKKQPSDAQKTQRIAKKQQRQESRLDALAAKLPEPARDKVKKNPKTGKRPAP